MAEPLESIQRRADSLQGIAEAGFKAELRFELVYDVAVGIGELAQHELQLSLLDEFLSSRPGGGAPQRASVDIGSLRAAVRNAVGPATRIAAAGAPARIAAASGFTARPSPGRYAPGAQLSPIAFSPARSPYPSPASPPAHASASAGVGVCFRPSRDAPLSRETRHRTTGSRVAADRLAAAAAPLLPVDALQQDRARLARLTPRASPPAPAGGAWGEGAERARSTERGPADRPPRGGAARSLFFQQCCPGDGSAAAAAYRGAPVAADPAATPTPAATPAATTAATTTPSATPSDPSPAAASCAVTSAARIATPSPGAPTPGSPTPGAPTLSALPPGGIRAPAAHAPVHEDSSTATPPSTPAAPRADLSRKGFPRSRSATPLCWSDASAPATARPHERGLSALGSPAPRPPAVARAQSDGNLSTCFVPLPAASPHARSQATHYELERFRRIRCYFGVTPATYARAFPDDLSSLGSGWRTRLKESVSEGASGAFFYRVLQPPERFVTCPPPAPPAAAAPAAAHPTGPTGEGSGLASRFIVKQISPAEKRTLMALLPAYERYVAARGGDSLIAYFGCHSMSLRWRWSGKVGAPHQEHCPEHQPHS